MCTAHRLNDTDPVCCYASNSKKRGEKLEVKQGHNRFVWNMRYPNAEDFEGMIVWSGGMGGPMAKPGKYQAKLSIGDFEQVIPFEIKPHPRSEATAEDYAAQFDYLMSVRDKLTETHKGIKKIRLIKKSISGVTGPMKGKDDYKDVLEAAGAMEKKLTAIEEALYQTKNRSRQDPLNFPIRLNDRLSGLNSIFGDHPPTKQQVGVRDMLFELIDVELAKLAEVEADDVPAFNKLVQSKQVPAIWLQDEDSEE